MRYSAQKSFEHGEMPQVGILLANLGTPDEPTAKGLRPYLAQFLSDPRIIEKPRWQWLPILHGIILRTRPPRSAALYKEIWTEEGSPLLAIGKKQKNKLEELLRSSIGTPISVELGMTYGNPSIPSALRELRERGAKRILVLPLYPHYSATSTASVYDAVFDEFKKWRWMPELRTITNYHDKPDFIEALARTVREAWKDRSKPEKLVLSYHGIPQEYFLKGDPYHCQCHKTTRLLAENLGLGADEYMTTFQSLFGKEKWLTPPTDGSLEALAESGVKSVDVICPGFSTDCLETLEEIEGENREVFMKAGGEKFNYIPALNDSDDFIRVMADMVAKNLYGWIISKENWNQAEQEEPYRVSREEYQKMANRD